MDMPEVDLNDIESHKELDKELQLAVEEKLLQRAEIAARVSITRLDYMVRVMRIVWNSKQTIANPDSFTDKIKRVERKERQKLVEEGMAKRANSMSSMGSSMYGQSKTGGTSARSAGSDASGDAANYDEHGEEGTDSIGMSSDPIIQGV